MMSNTRNAILGRAKVQRETITLTIDGEPVAVEVRGVTAGARGRLLNGSRGDDGALDFERYYAHLVIETAYDPATGEPIFAPADLDAINALPAPVVQQLAEKAEALSGLGAAAEALEKNSAATENVATGSDSPNDSAAQ